MVAHLLPSRIESSYERGHISSFSTRATTQNSLDTSVQWSTCSLAGRQEGECTNVLSKAERLDRSKQYKGLDNKTERARKKLELDKALRPRVTRCSVVAMYPTPLQHVWLLRWFKDARRTYNLGMNYVLVNRIHIEEKPDLGELGKMLQRTLVGKEGVMASKNSKNSAMLRTPKIIRQLYAIKEKKRIPQSAHCSLLDPLEPSAERVSHLKPYAIKEKKSMI